jgi:hypothetical protein
MLTPATYGINAMNLYAVGRIGAESAEQTQKDALNDRHSGYMTANYFSDPAARSHLDFAASYPTLMTSGSHLGGSDVDALSHIYMDVEQTRSLEKLQLNSRSFITVPYLGRGSCDPNIESQLMQGERAMEKKSINSIMSKSFMDYRDQPGFTVDPSSQVDGGDNWVRGGEITRRMAGDEHYSQKGKPIPL